MQKTAALANLYKRNWKTDTVLKLFPSTSFIGLSAENHKNTELYVSLFSQDATINDSIYCSAIPFQLFESRLHIITIQIGKLCTPLHLAYERSGFSLNTAPRYKKKLNLRLLVFSDRKITDKKKLFYKKKTRFLKSRYNFKRLTFQNAIFFNKKSFFGKNYRVEVNGI